MQGFKNILNAAIYRFTILSYKFRLMLQTSLKLKKSYQPNPYNEVISVSQSIRSCLDRFECINANLPDTPLSCLDIGCNEGYFTFKLSQRGGFCLGVDAGRNEIMVAESIKQINKVSNTAFTRIYITPETLSGFPNFDVINFLSVFHHVVRHNGLDYAKDLMKSIAMKNNRYLIFETGQPDESGVSWVDELNFMLPDIESWISEMLLEVGYKHIKVIGKHKAVKSDTPRLLFIAEK